MGSGVYQSLLKANIETFVNNFSTNSKNIFVNENGELIHKRRIW